MKTLTEFLMKRTLPSPMPTLTPPGCLLRGRSPSPARCKHHRCSPIRSRRRKGIRGGRSRNNRRIQHIRRRRIGRKSPVKSRGIAPPGEPAQV